MKFGVCETLPPECEQNWQQHDEAYFRDIEVANEANQQTTRKTQRTYKATRYD